MARQKRNLKPGTMVYPLPAVIVTCGDSPEHSNMLTVAWTGVTCTNPAMVYISVRPERYSYDFIRANMQFTINLTTAAMARATDWGGCAPVVITTNGRKPASHPTPVWRWNVRMSRSLRCRWSVWCVR